MQVVAIRAQYRGTVAAEMIQRQGEAIEVCIEPHLKCMAYIPPCIYPLLWQGYETRVRVSVRVRDK